MLDLKLFELSKKKLNVLVLGAHCDDIEIGCGGTLLRLLSERKNIHITWVVFCATAEREVEAKKSAADFLLGTKSQKITIHSFRDGYLPYLGESPKNTFEALKSSVNPDLIFTHSHADAHQDHRIISELTWNTFRDHFILEYEIPKWDGDFGQPNTFIDIPKSLAQKKITLLLKHYGSQRSKSWFNSEVFRSLMTLRGMESRSNSGLSEAFYCRKIKL